MVKLSQQLQDAETGQETRTQRVVRKQEFEREKRTFENLKTQATKKQKEFEGISSIDKYEQKYNLLDPNLKQFFQTPTTLRTEKTERIEETKLTIQEKHTFANQKILDAKEEYDKKKQQNQDWFDRKSQDQRENYRERFNKNKNDYADDYDEELAQWRGYKKGLDKGLGQLKQNQDIAFNEIESYAYDLSNYEESREEARNEKRDFERDQELERKKLKEAGYKPQVIEKSFKGKPTAVQIGFYNPKTKDWVSGAEFKIKAPVDVSGLERLGYSAPQQRKIEFAGKTYEFQSRVGIYKAPSGEIVTPYERTGVTEAQLIKQQQDIAFKEWKTKPKPYDVPLKIVKYKDLPVGYGGQQTISTEPTNLILSEKDYYRDVKKFEFGVGKIWDKAGEGIDWVQQRVHWDFSISGTPTSPKLSILKFGKIKEPTIVERAYTDALKDIEKGSQKLEEWVVGKAKIEKFKTGIEEKYQTGYQARFESKYMEDLIYGKKTFEEASTEFAESEEAKLLQKKFTKEYGEGYRELQTGLGFWKGTVAGGLGQTGLGLSKFWLKATGDPASATATTLAVGGAFKILKTIPPLISTGLTAGLGVYGGIKLFDPSSTYIEKGGGLLTLTIAGATLGYGAYRHLRSPIIKTVKIKAPKVTLKASEVIGKDIKIVTDKGMINTVIFENQKLSQIASAGRRTIVTTKGRVLLDKFWLKVGVPKKFITLDKSALYRGIPTEQLGKTFSFKGIKRLGMFKGDWTYTTKSAYQKALAKLTSYGYTPSQAKLTLRYIAPKITEQYLEKGYLIVAKTKAIGEFKYLTKRPVIDIDKSLGIKTRGGKTIKDVYDVERKLITIEKGTKVIKLILEQKTRIGFSLKGERLYKFTQAEFSKGIGISKATKTLKGYEYFGKDTTGFDIFKEAKYKDVYSISATKKLFSTDIVIDASKTKLINKIIDLRNKAYGQTYFGGKKTPFKVTFDDIVKKIKPTPSSDISKIVDKLDDIKLKTTPPPSVSKYYGTGQYEKSFGGLDAQTSRQLQQQLKVAVIPDPVKVFKLKDLIKFKQPDVFTGMKIAQLTAITGLKSDILKTELKARSNLKILLKGDVVLKTKVAQIPALKTSPILKSPLKTILDLKLSTPSLTADPIIKMPTIPRVPPPTIPPMTFPFLKAEILKRSKVKPFDTRSIQAYLPDFTSRALGLKVETITEKQARKKLKKLLTGLEIRRGVKLK